MLIIYIHWVFFIKHFFDILKAKFFSYFKGSATNKDKIFVRQDAVDLEDYEPFKYFKEHIRSNIARDGGNNESSNKCTNDHIQPKI